MKGIITKATGIHFSVRTDRGIIIAQLNAKLKIDQKKTLNIGVVGDRVRLEHTDINGWFIASIEPRRNYLSRINPSLKGLNQLLASNIDQALLIITLIKPRTSVGFIDRFLITLGGFDIPTILVFNKKDLYSDKERQQFQKLKSIYQTVDCKIILTSLLSETLDGDLLQGKTTLVSGHSGSGKSTLINTIASTAKQKTSPISSKMNKGVHTTSTSEMFEIDKSTYIIDSPGIKELGLSEVSKETLGGYFPEINAMIGRCKFHNCLHQHEPNCYIKSNIGSVIHPDRYQSYLAILDTI